jgi:hypothetical protein
MAGYLDSYGAGAERRERLVKTTVLAILAVVIIGGALYFTFRNWRQEQTLKQFLSLLQQKDYQGAYKLFGCTQDTPCKYYPPEQFTQDFGPSSPFANPSAVKTVHEDTCGNGVVFSLELPQGNDVGIEVERDTNLISFAPWSRCPGRHLQLWEFIKSRFS